MSGSVPTASAPVARPVDFGTAITTAFRHYARFDGTASISEFWWFVLFVGLVHAGLGTLDQLAVVEATHLGATLTGLWGLATLLPTLALAVRRLRDGGNTWAQLFWIVVPIAGVIVLVLRFCDPQNAAFPQTSGGASPDAPPPPDAPRI